jgi:hypothetical protein
MRSSVQPFCLPSLSLQAQAQFLKLFAGLKALSLGLGVDTQPKMLDLWQSSSQVWDASCVLVP